LISDQLKNMEVNAKTWVNETYTGIIDEGEYSGRVLELYWDNRRKKFGVASARQIGGDTTTCFRGKRLCKGYSTPQKDMKPFFQIRCGNAAYFGPNLYAFSTKPVIVNNNITINPIISYSCKDQPVHVRPTWKILGYYPLDCDPLTNFTYDDAFCNPTQTFRVLPQVQSLYHFCPPNHKIIDPLCFHYVHHHFHLLCCIL